MKLQSIRAAAKCERSIAPIHPLFAHPPYGIFSKVARQVGVSPSFARKVALGLHTSARVAKVANAEAERITDSLKRADRKRKAVAA